MNQKETSEKASTMLHQSFIFFYTVQIFFTKITLLKSHTSVKILKLFVHSAANPANLLVFPPEISRAMVRDESFCS